MFKPYKKSIEIIYVYLGQWWASFLAILCIPLYFKYLGAESFAVIGFLSVGLSVAAILELGIGSALMIKFNNLLNGAENKKNTQNILKKIEYISLIFGSIIIILYELFFNISNTMEAYKKNYIILMIEVIIILRIYEGIYKCCLFGLNKQFYYNKLLIITSSVRYLGALVIAAYQESIILFLIWQILSSVCLVTISNIKLKKSLKTIYEEKYITNKDRFWKLVWLNLLIITLNTFYLNIDKLTLIKSLSLKEFGEYSLCASAVSVLFLFTIPLTQYILPKFSSQHKRRDYKEINIIFKYHNNIILNLMTTITMVAVIFPEGVIYIWSGDIEVAKKIASIFRILILGTYFNAITYFPSQILIAANKINYNLVIMIMMNLIYILILIIADQNINSEFVAKVFLIINIFYYITITYVISKKIYINFYENIINISKIILTNTIILLLIGIIYTLDSYSENRIQWVGFLSVNIMICLIISLCIYMQKKSSNSKKY